MRNTIPTRPRPSAYIVCGALITLAVQALALRGYRSAAAVHLSPTVDTVSLLAAVVLVIAAPCYAFRLVIRNRRADAADVTKELDEIRGDLRETQAQVETLENQAWWGGHQHDAGDTVELGPNVVPLRRPRPGEAKGTAG